MQVRLLLGVLLATRSAEATSNNPRNIIARHYPSVVINYPRRRTRARPGIRFHQATGQYYFWDGAAKNRKYLGPDAEQAKARLDRYRQGAREDRVQVSTNLV